MSNEDKILEMLTSLTETVSKLSEGQTEMRSDIADLKATQTDHGKALEAVQATLAEHGTMLQMLDERSLKSAVLLETDVARDTRLLYEGHSGLKRQLATLATKEQVEDLSSDVEVIKSVVTRHSGDINKLKRAQ